MKRISVMGLVLSAMFGLSALTAAPASATLLCWEVDEKNVGDYTNANCTGQTAPLEYILAIPFERIKPGLWCAVVSIPKTGNKSNFLCSENGGSGKNEWILILKPGAGVGGGKAARFAVLPSVKTFIGVGAPSTLVGGGEKVECTGSTSTGEITSTTTIGHMVVVFKGCALSNGSGSGCTIKSIGSPAQGLIVTNTLIGTLGTVKASEAESEVGLELEPSTGKTFTTLAATASPCSSLETAVSGQLVGEVSPVALQEPSDLLAFGVTTSKQAITSFAGKTVKLTAFAASATEQTAEELGFGGGVEVT